MKPNYADPANPSWAITQRWQQYDGEVRANVLRLACIGLFYSIHLLRYWSDQGELGQVLQFGDAAVTPRFHLLVTLLAAAWATTAGGIQLCLAQRVFPRWLPVASTCLDLWMLTSVLMVSSGPRSPLVTGYFLILVLAAMRFSLPLVRLATAGAAVGYVCLLGLAKWPAIFGKADMELSVPRYHQLVTLAALLVAGVLLGQMVRRVRLVASDYAERVAGPDSC